MADEPLNALGGATPLEAAATPAMDSIAAAGASGTLLTLPNGFPTSSDVANLSVLGFNLREYYPGRGPLEAVARGVELGPDDIAWRCNLVHVSDGRLVDYSAGHIDDDTAKAVIKALQDELGDSQVSLHHGVSYRNILVTSGPEFSKNVDCHKPDSSQGMRLEEIASAPLSENDIDAVKTAAFIEDLKKRSLSFLDGHPLMRGLDNPPNMIWPWSPGSKPALPSFEESRGMKGAVITAVDVIAGIATSAGMSIIEVPGATGFVDTNYDGKAKAAIDAIDEFDLVYLHVEAMDECSHMGDVELKISAIEDFDSKIVAPVLDALASRTDVVFAVLPDHPAPVALRKHTRTPVPVAVAGMGIAKDSVTAYSEKLAEKGALGAMENGDLIALLATAAKIKEKN